MFNFMKHPLGYQLGVVLAMLKVMNKRDKVIIILKFFFPFYGNRILLPRGRSFYCHA